MLAFRKIKINKRWAVVTVLIRMGVGVMEIFLEKNKQRGERLIGTKDQVFYKLRILKYFAKFIKKHLLQQSPIFSKDFASQPKQFQNTTFEVLNFELYVIWKNKSCYFLRIITYNTITIFFTYKQLSFSQTQSSGGVL